MYHTSEIWNDETRIFCNIVNPLLLSVLLHYLASTLPREYVWKRFIFKWRTYHIVRGHSRMPYPKASLRLLTRMRKSSIPTTSNEAKIWLNLFTCECSLATFWAGRASSQSRKGRFHLIRKKMLRMNFFPTFRSIQMHSMAIRGPQHFASRDAVYWLIDYFKTFWQLNVEG